jgi:hypothetical protein
MKTNRELNLEFDRKQAEAIRPKAVEYKFESLQRIMNNWVLNTRLGGEQYSPFETVNS